MFCIFGEIFISHTNRFFVLRIQEYTSNHTQMILTSIPPKGKKDSSELNHIYEANVILQLEHQVTKILRIQPNHHIEDVLDGDDEPKSENLYQVREINKPNKTTNIPKRIFSTNAYICHAFHAIRAKSYKFLPNKKRRLLTTNHSISDNGRDKKRRKFVRSICMNTMQVINLI